MYTYAFVDNRNGRGEDAEPVLSGHFSSVFDGLGGAGSAIHKTKKFGDNSGAYIASRLAAEFFQLYFTHDKVSEIFSLFHEKETDELQKLFLSEMGFEAAQKFCEYVTDWYNEEGFQIDLPRSKTIKFLPTTMAGYLINPNSKSDDESEIISIWAGDSRCFVLTKEGLRQLSIDDTNGEINYYDELTNDSLPMNNNISLSRGFHLNLRYNKFKKPFIVLAATDGCFMYFDNPLKFEQYLLLSIVKSDSIETSLVEYQKFWVKRAHDDCSMALNAMGFESFDEVHAYIQDCLDIFNDKYAKYWKAKIDYRKNREAFSKVKNEYDVVLSELTIACTKNFLPKFHTASTDAVNDILAEFEPFAAFLKTESEHSSGIETAITENANLREKCEITAQNLILENWLSIRCIFLHEELPMYKAKFSVRRLCAKKEKLDKLKAETDENESQIRNILRLALNNALSDDCSPVYLVKLARKLKALTYVQHKKLKKYTKRNANLIRKSHKLRQGDIAFTAYVLQRVLSVHPSAANKLLRDVCEIDSRIYDVASEFQERKNQSLKLQNESEDFLQSYPHRFTAFLNVNETSVSKWLILNKWREVKDCFDEASAERFTDLSNEAETLSAQAKEIESIGNKEISTQWEEYRTVYEHYIKSRDDIVTTKDTTIRIMY